MKNIIVQTICILTFFISCDNKVRVKKRGKITENISATNNNRGVPNNNKGFSDPTFDTDEDAFTFVDSKIDEDLPPVISTLPPVTDSTNQTNHSAENMTRIVQLLHLTSRSEIEFINSYMDSLKPRHAKQLIEAITNLLKYYKDKDISQYISKNKKTFHIDALAMSLAKDAKYDEVLIGNIISGFRGATSLYSKDVVFDHIKKEPETSGMIAYSIHQANLHKVSPINLERIVSGNYKAVSLFGVDQVFSELQAHPEQGLLYAFMIYFTSAKKFTDIQIVRSIEGLKRLIHTYNAKYVLETYSDDFNMLSLLCYHFGTENFKSVSNSTMKSLISEVHSDFKDLGIKTLGQSIARNYE